MLHMPMKESDLAAQTLQSGHWGQAPPHSWTNLRGLQPLGTHIAVELKVMKRPSDFKEKSYFYY